MRLQSLLVAGTALAAGPLHAQQGALPALSGHSLGATPAPRSGAASTDDLSSTAGAISMAGDTPRRGSLLAAGRLSTPQTAAELVGDEVNLVALGAVGDAYSYPGAAMAAGSTTLTSYLVTFSTADIGKQICDTGAGNNTISLGPQGEAMPLCGTIVSLVDKHAVDVTFAAQNQTPSVGSANITISNPGTGYTPGDLIDINIPNAINGNVAVQKVADTEVVSASLSAGGSGISYTGTCVVIGTTGTLRNSRNGTYFEANVAISSGSVTRVVKTINPGDYIANPNLTETVVGATTTGTSTGCPITAANGVSLSLTMGVQSLLPYAYGAYPSISTTSAYPTSDQTSNTGSSLTVFASGDFPVSGIFTYGTDDSTAYAEAVDLVNLARSEGAATLLYVPPGECASGSTTACSIENTGAYFFGPTTASDPFTNGGGIVTDANYSTIFYMSPRYPGTPSMLTGAAFQPLIWWLANPNSGDTATSFDGPAYAFSELYSPSLTGGIIIAGDRTAPSTQVGMAFCGSNYFAEIHDYQFRNLPGTGLLYGCTTAKGSTLNGITLNAATTSHNRESRFYSIRGFNSGASPQGTAPNFAAIDINTQNTDPKQSASMDDVGFDNVELFGNHGNGIIIHAADVNGSIGFVNFTGRLRVEGLAPDGTPLQGNLIQVGDTSTSMDGTINNVSFPDGMQLIDPYVGTTANPSAAFLVTTSSSGTTHGVVPYGITTGAGMNISGGAPYGNGLDVAACKNCVFNILLIAVDGYSYMQGNSTLTSKITLKDFLRKEKIKEK